MKLLKYFEKLIPI